MEVVVLSGDRALGWHVQDLQRAATKLGLKLSARSWRDVQGGVAAGALARAGDLDLAAADGLLLRTMPAGTLEQIIFRMDLLQVLAQRQALPMINSPRALEIAVDKYLALARMHAAGLPTPPTLVCQRLDQALAAFAQLGGDVVVKPLFGSEGFGITRVSDPDLAARAFALLEKMGSVLYLQQYLAHGGEDYRLFVLGERVIGAIRRVSADWRTNVARGGKAENFAPDAALCQLALRAARACAAEVAGVDIVLRPQPYVLEVNAVPGWRALCQATGVDVAAEMLDHLRQLAAGHRLLAESSCPS